MNFRTARLLLSRFSDTAFGSFVYALFQERYREYFEPIIEYDQHAQGVIDAFSVVDLNFFSPPTAFLQGYSAYFPYSFPLALMSDPTKGSWVSPQLVDLIVRKTKDFSTPMEIREEVDIDGLAGAVLTGIYVLSNISGLYKEEYENVIIPQLEDALEPVGLNAIEVIGIGSPDSFFEADAATTTRVLEEFLVKNINGISISIHPDKTPLVSDYVNQASLASGVTRYSRQPVEPIEIRPTKSEVLLEFEHNLKQELSESQWEKFFSKYYQEVFGNKYDRIETQLWLRTPQMSPKPSSRRLDLLLRNTLANDWDLVELKLPGPIIMNKRGILEFRKIVYSARQQALEYYKLLKSDKIRQALAKEGIEYFEPELMVVIGRRPAVPESHWRWLLNTNSDLVKLLTYDDLLDEIRSRSKKLY